MKRFANKKKVKRFLIKDFEIQNKAAGLIIKVKFYLIILFLILFLIFIFICCYGCNNVYYNFKFDFKL